MNRLMFQMKNQRHREGHGIQGEGLVHYLPQGVGSSPGLQSSD